MTQEEDGDVLVTGKLLIPIKVTSVSLLLLNRLCQVPDISG
jgi:hypothetical protein